MDIDSCGVRVKASLAGAPVVDASIAEDGAGPEFRFDVDSIGVCWNFLHR
jgi:hypothetical protein